MKKKILVISSSPRKGGNSDALCDAFIKGAQDTHECEKVFLRDYQISYCSGCGNCNNGLACPLQDDMAPLLDKLISSDVIVLATPVYFYTMCGQMKTFIDRCCAKYTAIKNKEFYVIATAAENNKRVMERTIDGFQGFFDCLDNPMIKNVLYAHGVWQIGDVQQSTYLEEAYQMGKNA